MYAVGRLGSYISRGVYSVSGPFHPFGGAVDIIVVEQPDGSFRSSPWYVKFGKFQGVLKAKEKIVKIDVDGVDAGFHMYLDKKGEAYFIKEVDGEEDCADSNLYPSSSSDEASDGQYQSVKGRKLMKSQTFNVDTDVLGQIDSGEGRIVALANSRRSRILGFVFGRRSMKDEIFRAEEKGLGPDVGRVDSLERAEIAADLLELKWSKSLTTKKYRKDGTSRFSTPCDVRDMKDGTDICVNNESSRRDSGDVPAEVTADNHTAFSVVAGENRTSFCESTKSLHSGLHGSNGKVAEGYAEEVRLKTILVQDEVASKDSAVVELETTYRETQEVILLNSFNDHQNEYRDDIITRDAGRENNQLTLESVGNLENFFSSGDVLKPASSPSSGSSEEVQFQFTDMDDLNTRKKITVNRYSQVLVNGEETNMCLEKFDDKHSSDNSEDDDDKVISTPINISKLNEAVGDDEEVGRLAESMPPMRSQIESIDPCLIQAPLSQSLDMDNKHLDLSIPSKGHESPQKTKETLDQEHLYKSGNEEILSEDLCRLMSPSSGGWRLWPFSFKRSRSGKVMQDTSISSADIMEKSLDRCVSSNKFFLKPKSGKKIVRYITPTTEQLSSLNLKEGSNSVTFTFSTAMLGDQQVDARIYLWKWNTRIIISDVDGTITKSDVLGQFMPLVGMDWSQTGVAHLYNAIKENGYQLLFLSARAISQAYHTRRFLLNLKQDGKGLPDGPVVISPDGLFPSLFREVIRRAPHEFKIACLEDIKALFPPDSNPFYAGFGNRITDEISYLKVGIPKGKIFTINPRGEVVVNKHVNTKSYASLHALVHGMFPPTAKSEQEDFNSWNYWKLPPPDIDI